MEGDGRAGEEVERQVIGHARHAPKRIDRLRRASPALLGRRVRAGHERLDRLRLHPEREEFLRDLLITAHVAGRTVRSIATEHGCAASTISRLLKADDIRPIIEEQRTAQAEAERREKAKATDRAKSARHASRKAGYATSPADLSRKKATGSPLPIREQRTSSADGRLLGYASWDSRSGLDWRYHRNTAAGGNTPPPPTDEELDALERKLGVTPLSAVVLDSASRSYDPTDREDIARCALWITDLRPDLDDRDVRATLSTIQPGARITFPQPEQ